jgi:M6 family metalloprotease-like protein
MKKVLLLLFCSTTLFAVPAKRTPTIVSQPDGTRFNVVGFGDERYNYTETLDGYVVVRGSDAYWYYATLSPEGRYIPSAFRVPGGGAAVQAQAGMDIPRHLKESAEVVAERTRSHTEGRNISAGGLAKSVPAPNRTQAGVHRVLVLCVEFSNLGATQAAASFQDMVNNDSWKSGIGGMSKYFKDVSYNSISLQADYRDWITAASPRAYYAYNNPDFFLHVQELVQQCVDSAEASGVDFSLYDNDSDGVVDGLFVVHAGKGAEEGGQTQYIWSHSGDLGSYSRTYDGKAINSYIIMPELYGTAHVDIGVFCHEYGHALGLPDLYDTNGSTNGTSEGLGNWCLMASGSWGETAIHPRDRRTCRRTARNSWDIQFQRSFRQIRL